MSAESYVDSIRSQIGEREKRVGEVVDMLRRIVRDYAEFDDASVGRPMVVPSAEWNAVQSSDRVCLSLYNRDGEQIDEADVPDMDDKENAVGSAGFVIFDAEAIPSLVNDGTAMTIETQPPNVRGYDGSPLSIPQLGGAIADLHRYEVGLASDTQET